MSQNLCVPGVMGMGTKRATTELPVGALSGFGLEIC